RRFALDLMFKRPFEDIDDLLAGMRVSDGRGIRRQLDARLDDLMAGDAEILTLKVGPSDPVGLLLHNLSPSSIGARRPTSQGCRGCGCRVLVKRHETESTFVIATTGRWLVPPPRTGPAAPTPRSAPPAGAGCNGSGSDRRPRPNCAGRSRSQRGTR